MKLVTKYVAVNANIAPMDSAQELRELSKRLGISDPEIIQKDIRMLETGDKITISICFGHYEDVDGIVTGGTYHDVTGVFESINDVIGILVMNTEYGSITQVMNRDMDNCGFPYENVRLS